MFRDWSPEDIMSPMAAIVVRKKGLRGEKGKYPEIISFCYHVNLAILAYFHYSVKLANKQGEPVLLYKAMLIFR